MPTGARTRSRSATLGGTTSPPRVLALSEVLDAGWAVRAYWGGDPLDGEREVTAHELADLIEQSRLDRRTLYRVR